MPEPASSRADQPAEAVGAASSAVSCPSCSASRRARIRALNDALRRHGAGDRVVLTAGVAALPHDTLRRLVVVVARFEAFGPDNDPHEEHDFGAVEVDGVRCFWKIDAYDRVLRCASPDPADPAVTLRVLTLMLAEEY